MVCQRQPGFYLATKPGVSPRIFELDASGVWRESGYHLDIGCHADRQLLFLGDIETMGDELMRARAQVAELAEARDRAYDDGYRTAQVYLTNESGRAVPAPSLVRRLEEREAKLRTALNECTEWKCQAAERQAMYAASQQRVEFLEAKVADAARDLQEAARLINMIVPGDGA